MLDRLQTLEQSSVEAAEWVATTREFVVLTEAVQQYFTEHLAVFLNDVKQNERNYLIQTLERDMKYLDSVEDKESLGIYKRLINSIKETQT